MTTKPKPAKVCECLRCGHVWTPRKPGRPVRCANPACKTPYWDKPRENPGLATRRRGG